MSDGAVVGIVIGALVAVGLIIGLVFVLVGGDAGPQAAGTTDTTGPEDATTGASQPDDPATDTTAPGPDDEPGPSGATDTTVPGGEPAISSVSAEQLFGDAEGFTFVALAPDDLATAKRDFLAADQFLEVAVEEIAVREIERDGTNVGAVFAVSLDEALALAPGSEETFLAGAKEGLGGGGEDLVLAGQPAFYGETAGVPFVVSLKEGIFLFVLGEDRSTCERVMTELLGNIS